MKAQATIEFMMIFLVTMAAIAMIFYPLAKAHRDFGAEAEVVKDKQNFEDFIYGAQIYCNGNFKTPSSILGAPGHGFKIQNDKVFLVLDSGKKEFKGFFKGCTNDDSYEPV